MSGRDRYFGWVRWMVAGETTGFAVAASAAALVRLADTGPSLTYGLMVLAGAVEGGLLGFGQSVGFSRAGLTVPRAAWIAVTSAAAALAWSIGLLPSTVPGLDWTAPLTWLVASALALTLLLSIPAAQWPILRRRVNKAWRWVPINMVAWTVGLFWTLAPSPLVNDTTPLGALIAIYAVAGFLMATTVALITGWEVIRLRPLHAYAIADGDTTIHPSRSKASLSS